MKYLLISLVFILILLYFYTGIRLIKFRNNLTIGTKVTYYENNKRIKGKITQTENNKLGIITFIWVNGKQFYKENIFR